jgi:hypothetical protein
LGSKLDGSEGIFNLVGDAASHFTPGFHPLDPHDLGHIFKKADEAQDLTPVIGQRGPGYEQRKDLSLAAETELALTAHDLLAAGGLQRQEVPHNPPHFIELRRGKHCAIVAFSGLGRPNTQQLLRRPIHRAQQPEAVHRHHARVDIGK